MQLSMGRSHASSSSWLAVLVSVCPRSPCSCYSLLLRTLLVAVRLVLLLVTAAQQNHRADVLQKLSALVAAAIRLVYCGYNCSTS